MEVAKHLDGVDPNPLSHLEIHPGGGCSLIWTYQLCCRTDTMTGSRAAQPSATKNHSWLVLCMPSPALPSLVLLIQLQHP